MDATRTGMSSEDEEREFEQAFGQFRELLNREEIDADQPLGPAAVYTAMMTVWLLVYQRLHAGCSLAQAVTEFVQGDPEGLPQNRRVRAGTLSTNTASYSRARTRLKVVVTERVAQRVYDSLVAALPPTLGDRRVFMLDGTTITLAPTPVLRAAFPPARNQHGASVWPVAQLLVAHELESGCALLPELGPMYGDEAISEVRLAQALLPRLPAKSVLLADRNFGVFTMVHAAVHQGHDVVLRLTKSRFKAIRRRATLITDDCLERRWEVKWTPSSRERKDHPELPADASVRVWLHEYIASEKLTLWFVTTWDCDTAVPAHVYRRRVDVETDIRDVKVTLQTEQLQAKTKPMVQKELATSIVAYNLVVQLRRLAAKIARVPPRRLSFTGVWRTLRIVLLAPQNWSAKEWGQRFKLALKMASQQKLPNRPNRSYPRVALVRRNKSTSGSKKPKPPDPK